MSLFSALTLAVEGLNAQSAAINNVSNNVANAETVGYKAVGTTFESLVDGTGTSETGGGVATSNSQDNTLAGTLQSSSSNTSLAISGQGFFTVQTGVTNPDGTDSVSGSNLYTRQGDFTVNADGYMANSSQDFLMGYAVNSSGVVDTSTLVPIQISQTEVAPVATTSVDYAANLPSSATTADTYSASALQIYDSLGTAHTLDFNWVNTGTNTWQLTVSSATPTDGSADLSQQFDVTFNDGSSGTAGTLESITAVGGGTGTTSVSVASDNSTGQPADVTMGLDIPGAGPQSIVLNLGTYGTAVGTTQYAGSTVNVTSTTQNGVPPGSYSSLTIDSSGNVTVNYSNGQTKTAYQIPIATFNAADELQSESGGAYAATLDSGTAKYNEAGANGAGSIDSSELEDSNVDIAGQFSTMIQAQEVYSANSKTISTVNSMLTTLLDVIQ